MGPIWPSGVPFGSSRTFCGTLQGPFGPTQSTKGLCWRPWTNPKGFNWFKFPLDCRLVCESHLLYTLTWYQENSLKLSAQKGSAFAPKWPFWGTQKVLEDPKGTPEGQMGPMDMIYVGWNIVCAWLHIVDHFCNHQGPKGTFWGPEPLLGAPFLVRCSFGWNIGVWGVQVVATECPDHLTLLQSL